MTAETPHERFLKNLHKTVFMLDRSADRLLSSEHKGSFSQFLLLIAIAKCGKASQQRIAEFLNLTPAAVSRQIDALVHEGLIERHDDPHSRRAHVITLTPAGEKRFAAMRLVLLDAFKEPLGAIGETELESMNAGLEAMLRSLEPAFTPHTSAHTH